MRRVRSRQLRLEQLADRRVLASITGTVFEDVNYSFGLDADDVAAPARLVYVDANNNATLDPGEQYALADQSGQFQLNNLQDGTFQIRLLGGSNSQTQTTPVAPTVPGAVLPLSDTSGVVRPIVTETSLQLVTETSILLISDRDFQSVDATIRVADSIDQVQPLPGGSLLVIGSDASGDTAWIVDTLSRQVTPVDLAVGEALALGLTDIAIDGQGRGVAIGQDQDDDGQVELISIDATNPDDGLLLSATGTLVPSGARVLASATGVRSVLAWPTPDGLELSLWSNLTGSFISESPVQVDDASSLLTFDDQSGLLVVQTADGGIRIVDANNEFASLHVFAEQTGPVAIDGNRDLLFAFSIQDAALKVVDLSDGSTLSRGPVDLTNFGTPTAIAVGRDSDSLIVLGPTGVGQVRFNQAQAHQVVIQSGGDVSGVNFGVSVIGQNTPPSFTQLPTFETPEDTDLVVSAPGAGKDAFDAQSDQFAVLIHPDSTGDASSLAEATTTAGGRLTVGSDGSLRYQPEQDFFGTDQFTVFLHDGRDISEAFSLEIVVTPTPDDPTDIIINTGPVPEDLQPGQPIGDVEVIDVDGPGHIFTVDDPRLDVVNGEIIFVGGVLDFETEPFFPVTLTVTDSQTDQTIEETLLVSLRDRNDPITGITPTEASVFENSVGDVVAELRVLDQDVEQFHTLEVDDPRFIVQESELRLAPGVSLDFEAEPQVVVNVTASEAGGDNTFTQAITITVRDRAEQVADVLELANDTVLERSAAATVGEVLLNGSAPDPRYNLVVDDGRFEVVRGALQLRSGQFVNLDSELEIELSITAIDTFGELDDVMQTFLIRVLQNESPAHNVASPHDVDHSDEVTAFDALLIINYLNRFGPGPVDNGDFGFSYDVNADGQVTVLDALLVINQINRISGGRPTVGGEGEAGPAAPGSQPPNRPQPLQQAPLRALRVVSDDVESEDQSLDQSGLIAPAIQFTVRDLQFAQLARAGSDLGVDNRLDVSAEDLASQSEQVADNQISELEQTLAIIARGLGSASTRDS